MGDLDTERETIYDTGDTTPQLLVLLATVWETSALPVPPAAPAPEPPAETGTDGSAAEAPTKADVDPELAALADLAGLTEAIEAVEDAEDDLKDFALDDDVQPLRVPIDANTTIRIDCWYISRRVRRFKHLTPQVVPDAELPALPAVGWHLRQHERLRSEVDALTRAGYAISLEELDADHKAPLECCLSLARRESHYILIAVTAADYPQQRPNMRRAPMSAMKDLGENERFWDRLWKASEPVPESLYPDWAWTPERQIIDLAREIEPRITEGKQP